MTIEENHHRRCQNIVRKIEGYWGNDSKVTLGRDLYADEPTFIATVKSPRGSGTESYGSSEIEALEELRSSVSEIRNCGLDDDF